MRTTIIFSMTFYPENDDQVKAFMQKFAEAKDNIEMIGALMPFYKNKPADFDLRVQDNINKIRRFDLTTGDFEKEE